MSRVDATSNPNRLLALFLEDPSAKERGVSAVYLLSGYARPVTTNNVKQEDGDENGMDIDEPTQSSSVDPPTQEGEAIKTRTVKLVALSDLEGENPAISLSPFVQSN